MRGIARQIVLYGILSWSVQSLGVNFSEFEAKDLPAYSCEIAILTEAGKGDICSGSLIDPYTILTAKHCLRSKSTFYVTCPDPNAPATRTVVSEAKVLSSHPSLDMGLLKADLYLHNKTLEVAASPEEVYRLIHLNKCYGFGYGRQDVYWGGEQQIAHRGRRVSFNWNLGSVLVDPFLNKYHISTKASRRPGDSGGPLVCLDERGTSVLIGVHSSGNYYRSVATNVGFGHDWLADLPPQIRP